MTIKEKIDYLCSKVGIEDLYKETIEILDKKREAILEGLSTTFEESKYDCFFHIQISEEEFYTRLERKTLEIFNFWKHRSIEIKELCKGQLEEFYQTQIEQYPEHIIKEQFLTGAASIFKDGYNLKLEELNIERQSDYYYIMIHMPHIIIKNENGDEHNLYDIYFRINFQYDYTIFNIEISRGTLSIKELDQGYFHSHCPSLRIDPSEPMNRRRNDWRYICLGSGELSDLTSDLSHTYGMLKVAESPLWLKFFFLIEEFAKTESLEGGPYISFTSLGKSEDYYDLEKIVVENFYDKYKLGHKFPINLESIKKKAHVSKKVGLFYMFLDYLIDNVTFRFSISEGDYISLGYSPNKLWELLSNAFIEFYNYHYNKELNSSEEEKESGDNFLSIYFSSSFEKLIEDKILVKTIKDGNRFHILASKAVNYRMSVIKEMHNNLTLFRFKDKDITLKIKDFELQDTDNLENYYTLISPRFAILLKLHIETFINFRFNQNELPTKSKYEKTPFTKIPVSKKGKIAI